MISLDPSCASQISYRPGYLLDPIVGPGAEVQICDRLLQEFHTIGIQYAMLPQQPGRHPRVASHLAFFAKPFQMAGVLTVLDRLYAERRAREVVANS